MSKKQKIEYFIPANALQTIHNPEHFTLHEKLRFAILRYFLHKDYYSPILIQTALPGVLIEKKTLSRDPLGYTVLATIKC